jgi:hypothetical protein
MWIWIPLPIGCGNKLGGFFFNAKEKSIFLKHNGKEDWNNGSLQNELNWIVERMFIFEIDKVTNNICIICIKIFKHKLGINYKERISYLVLKGVHGF